MASNLYTRLLSPGDTRVNKTSVASSLVGDGEDPNNGSSSPPAGIEWQDNTGLCDKTYGAPAEGQAGEPMMVSGPLTILTLKNNEF